MSFKLSHKIILIVLIILGSDISYGWVKGVITEWVNFRWYARLSTQEPYDERETEILEDRGQNNM